MFRSIRWRIAVPYVALTLLTILALTAFVTSRVRNDRLDALQARLRAESQLSAQFLEILLEQRADPQTVEALADDWARSTGSRVTIIARDGQTCIPYADGYATIVLVGPEMDTALLGILDRVR